MSNPTHRSHIDMSSEINDRMRADHVFESFVGNSLEGDIEDGTMFPAPRNFDCLKSMVNLYEEHCGKFTDYALKYIKYLVKECETVPSGVIDGSMHRLRTSCQH